jgi:excisionase family DNA binding protein
MIGSDDRTTAATVPATRLLYRVEDAAELLSLSRSVVYDSLRNRRLRSVQEGRTRLIPASALAEYVSRLEQEVV